MLGAVIRNGNNTLVVDLPTGTMDLQTKLNSIGIQETSDKIKLSDEDGNPIRVKLYATTAEEVHQLVAVRHRRLYRGDQRRFAEMGSAGTGSPV